jgi:acyl carrier protein
MTQKLSAQFGACSVRDEFVECKLFDESAKRSTDVPRNKMTDTNFILTKVQEAFKTSFDVDPQSVTLDTTASDIPGWDSVGHLALGSDLEVAFGISLDVDELMEMESVRDIVRIIEKNLSKRVERDRQPQT